MKVAYLLPKMENTTISMGSLTLKSLVNVCNKFPKRLYCIFKYPRMGKLKDLHLIFY